MKQILDGERTPSLEFVHSFNHRSLAELLLDRFPIAPDRITAFSQDWVIFNHALGDEMGDHEPSSAISALHHSVGTAGPLFFVCQGRDQSKSL